MQVPATLQQFHSAVRAEMQRFLEGQDLPLYRMLRYHLGWSDAHGAPLEVEVGGKGLRSTLCLLANQAVGGDWRQALPAAAALELLHNFSLIHDDIQDGSPERRGRLAVWRVWGEAQAINAGDSLFAVSHLPLYRLAELGVPPDRVLHLAQTLDETCLRLCEGQYMDVAFQERLDISLESYLTMVEGKTAALMAASCYLGAFLGTEAPAPVRHLRQAGLHLGFAFQIRDDVLGVWGSAAALGKPVAEDLRTRKKSLPVVLAFSRANPAQRQVLEQAYHRGPMAERDVRRVQSILEELDARGQAQRLAEQHSHASLAELEATGLSQRALSPLKELARFALERDF